MSTPTVNFTAQSGCRIAHAATNSQERTDAASRPYTGWTIYGYWHEGTLLNRAQFKQTHYQPRAVQDWPLPDVKLKRDAEREERRIRRAAWVEQSKHASLSRHEAAVALESHLGYAIPTLDEAML